MVLVPWSPTPSMSSGLPPPPHLLPNPKSSFSRQFLTSVSSSDTPKNQSSSFSFFSTLFFCLFSFPSPYFSLSLFLKRAVGIPCFEKYFPEDLCLKKVYNIWNSDNVFKIMMVMLIAIVIVASNYYVFYIWGTVLRTLYTSANLILTGALERSIIILPSLQSRKLRLREVQWLAQGHTARSRARAPAQPCWIPNSKFQPSCLPHRTS